MLISDTLKRLFLILACITACSFGNAQTLVDSLRTKITVEDLHADLKILRNTLESSQPGLYLYTSKKSLDEIFDRIDSSFTEPLTSIEFFMKIAPLNRVLKNLHTRLWPSAAYEKAMETALPRFPLDIHWLNDKMYVLRNNSNDATIDEGTVIVSINGQRSKEVFQTVLDCRVRDGNNETYPIAQASRNFGFYYAQLIGTPDSFRFELTTPTGVNKIIDVKAVNASQIHNSRATKYRRKYCEYSEDWDAWMAAKEPALRFELKDKFAVLTVKTFYLPIIEENGQNYEEFFKKSFDQLISNDIKDLVIDLRNNHGGTDPVAMSLLSHLHNGHLYYYKRRSSILKPDAVHVKKNGVYEIVGSGVWTGKVTPAKNIYMGKVYVLMNGYCVSAAGEFIGHLKNLNRGVFIGEECGGNPVIFTGGPSVTIDLPHTRITGTIPLQLVEMNVGMKNTGQGVTPDHEIKPGIDDILHEKDVEMEFVLRLINQKG